MAGEVRTPAGFPKHPTMPPVTAGIAQAVRASGPLYSALGSAELLPRLRDGERRTMVEAGSGGRMSGVQKPA